MARKKKYIETEDGSIDTGIFIKYRPGPILSEKDWQKAMPDEPPDLGSWLRERVKWAAEILRPYIDPNRKSGHPFADLRKLADSGIRRRAADIGDGWWLYHFNRDVEFPPVVDDAFEFQSECRRALHYVESGSTSKWLPFQMHAIGCIEQRILVRGAEEYVLTGRRVKDRNSKNARTTNQLHADLIPKYQPEVDELVKSGESYTSATEKVAIKLGVHGRTVRNHTKNPKPRNRKRAQQT